MRREVRDGISHSLRCAHGPHSLWTGQQGRTELRRSKTDVTSDVLKAVIDKAEYHGGSFDIEGGDEKWIVTVTKAAAISGQKPAEGETLK